MGVKLGDVFPNFDAETNEGSIKFHDWIGDSWAILFSHPADFTPVCATELGKAAKLYPEFEKRGVKLIALSCDSASCHKGFIKDILCLCPDLSGFPFPIIADPTRDLAVKLEMLDPDEKDAEGLPLTCRSVFIISPDKKLKLSMLYPATTGRNMSEILRVVDSLQLTATKKVATPADWVPGGACMVVPTLSKDEAKTMFPEHEVKEMPSGKEYIRYTPQPQ